MRSATHLVYAIGEHKCGEEIDAEKSESWHAQALAYGSPVCIFLGVVYIMVQRHLDKKNESANLRGLESIQNQFEIQADISYGAINQYAAAVRRAQEESEEQSKDGKTSTIANPLEKAWEDDEPTSPEKDTSQSSRQSPRYGNTDQKITMEIDLKKLPPLYTGQLEGPTWEVLLEVPSDVVIRHLETESEGCQAMIGTVQVRTLGLLFDEHASETFWAHVVFGSICTRPA